MNGMWGMVVTAVGIAAILGSIYLIWTIGKFPGIKKITKDSKLLKIIIPTVILAAGFGIFVITMSVINAVIGSYPPDAFQTDIRHRRLYHK